MANDGGDGAVSGLSKQYQLDNMTNMTFVQSPQGTFVPSEFKGHNGQFGAGSASGSQQDLQVKLIEHQIEVIPLNGLVEFFIFLVLCVKMAQNKFLMV